MWLSFEPLFLLFLGAFYGPVPLLIIIADIHPVLCANYYPPPTNIRSEAEPRKFLSSRLIEYYLNEQKHLKYLNYLYIVSEQLSPS